jgi:peptidoglycan-N-acetylglucosamine deacetylase
MKPKCILFVALLTLITGISCAEPKPIQSGIVLTFDDRGVDQWVKQIPLFAKYDAKVTFFVDNFHTLKPEQIEGLRQLKAAGHTVGCHGVAHRKAVDTIAKVGVEEYLSIEIDPAVQRMTDAGLAPTSFAYPSSQRNAESDQALEKSFRHLHGGTGVPEGTRIADLNTIFYTPKAIADTHCLIGTGIDYTGTEKRPDYLEQINEAMDRAKAKGEVVVFYAHGISAKGPGHHIPPKALEAILAHAQAIGLGTLTYDDLP